MTPKEIESTLRWEIEIRDERWIQLKNWVADTGISLKDSPSKDYQTGHNEALEGILHYIRTLEEK